MPESRRLFSESLGLPAARSLRLGVSLPRDHVLVREVLSLSVSVPSQPVGTECNAVVARPCQPSSIRAIHRPREITIRATATSGAWTMEMFVVAVYQSLGRK